MRNVPMQPFLFNTTHSILQEPGGVRRLGSLCQERGARRVLIVTDAGIHRLGLLNNALDSLSQAGVATEVFPGVEADPSDRTVLRAAEMAKGDQTDLVIGFGGGSSMDVAKLVALLASPTCRQSLNQIYGVDQARGQRLPLILVPTTAGTGSEVTPIAIVTTGETTKAGVVSPVLLPDLALLGAELTLGLPPHVTAATGIDAMVHAIEAYTSKLKKKDRKSTRLNSSHVRISYAVFCLKKKKNRNTSSSVWFSRRPTPSCRLGPSLSHHFLLSS